MKSAGILAAFAALMLFIGNVMAVPSGKTVEFSSPTGKVKAAVLEEPSLKSAEIYVETFKGIVRLSGFVGSRADIDKAVKVAKGVKGVKSVKNDMILKEAK